MSMVCIYALGDNSGISQHCCPLCVMHNSVGSALLVPTVDGHTRASMRGTGDSTAPTLFCFLIMYCQGAAELHKHYIYYETIIFEDAFGINRSVLYFIYKLFTK